MECKMLYCIIQYKYLNAIHLINQKIHGFVKNQFVTVYYCKPLSIICTAKISCYHAFIKNMITINKLNIINAYIYIIIIIITLTIIIK